MTTRLRWVVLDVDDTITDTKGVGFAKVQAASASLGLAVPTKADFFAVFGVLTFEECVARWHPSLPVERFTAAYDAAAAEHPQRALVDGGALVRSLQERGLRAGVLTNAPRRKVGGKLKAAGIAIGTLDLVRCGDDDDAVAKPAPEAFVRLAEACGDEPRTIAYVTDSPLDCAGCLVAGVVPIGVCTGIWDRDAFRARVGPGVTVLDDCAGVVRLLGGRGSRASR